MTERNYLKETANAAKKVYNSVIEYQCMHTNEAFCFEDIIEKRSIDCAASMSISLQIAGCLSEGVIVSHTSRCGLRGKKLMEKKSHIQDCMTNHEKLMHCDVIRVDTLYKRLPDHYRKAGVCYIYDSNCAVSAGDGSIYSCNNGPLQFNLKKQYRKNKMRRGYCFSHPILYCIVPHGQHQ